MNDKRILVFGDHGQLSQAFHTLLGERAQYAGRNRANFIETPTVLKVLDKIKPEIIINTAAYTAVDKAEENSREAELVNFITPGAIAQWAAQHQSLMVHFSTDYVFDGFIADPHTEEDTPQPLSVYGRTKLFGDQAILQTKAKSLILRTSWVFSPVGQNFLNTMIRLGAEREELSVIFEQMGAPTYTIDLAQTTLKMLEHPKLPKLLEHGGQIYNVCGQGHCSWYQFAVEIFRQAPEYLLQPLKIKAIKPIRAAEYPTIARRPLNSRLSTLKLERDFEIQMPHWKEALIRALKSKAELENPTVASTRFSQPAVG